MAVIKCKMCGGDLELIEGSSVCECEYCGTKQTVPDTNDEKRLNLYNRANRLRIACEFDKAAGIYENIIAEFPEEAEAYWGLCLSNYGIEYVDDPATARKVPTCHRASFEKMRKDENYELALENADMASRMVYEDQAKEIDRIMGEILAVSRAEEPYDIFICYKEADRSGARTPDSVLAQDIYDALTAKGYRVFFSRITLEDKLGAQYEPYIFSALQSAKVMLVVGTDYEYLNAVWVKNEWSRFLKLMAKDKTKVLIPCYKDMDPYDMPDEFRGLQSQDCGKLGFIQDLTRGIDKLFGKTTKSGKASKVKASAKVNPSIDSYLQRIQIFLEDGEWKNADAYCEKVLDIDPKNGEAYLGKLMAELHVGLRQEMMEYKSPIDLMSNYIKAMRYGDDSLKQFLEDCRNKINNDIGPGSSLNFGKYHGKIEWIVLEKKDGRVLVISKQGLAVEQYGQGSIHYIENGKLKKGDSWDTSILRSWLNDTFLKTAFSKEEQKKITRVIHDEEGPEAVDDKIFLLSISEAKRYYASNSDRQCILADHEKTSMMDGDMDGNGFCRWWLRSSGKDITRAAYVGVRGIVSDYGEEIWKNFAVRPVMWISFNSIEYEREYERREAEKEAERLRREEEEAKKQEEQERREAIERAERQRKKELEKQEADYAAACHLQEVAKKREDYIRAADAFNDVGLRSYKDSAERAAKCRMEADRLYKEKKENADYLYASGDYIAAYNAYLEIRDTKLENDARMRVVGYIINKRKGIFVKLGRYPQAANINSALSSAIEWTILENDGNEAILISRFGLEYLPYSSGEKNANWSNSSLRSWLNNEFLKSAFTDEEAELLKPISIVTEVKKLFGQSTSVETQDKVVLLSIEEAERLFSNDNDRITFATYLTREKGADTKNGACWWWLLTSDGNVKNAPFINHEGKIIKNSTKSIRSSGVVRPVIVLRLP